MRRWLVNQGCRQPSGSQRLAALHWGGEETEAARNKGRASVDLNLNNRVAIVTGGSRGLGRAICLGLAAEGAPVAISYLRAPEAGLDLGDEAAELAEVIRAEHGVRALPVGGDVAQEADIERLFAETERELGPVEILVNNAGVWPTALVRDMSEAEFLRVLQINLVGAFLACRTAVRRWQTAGRAGRIVNITSQAAFHGATSGHAHYAASKAGLVSFSLSLAREVASSGIAVNLVAPGMMRTEMAREALTAREQQYLERIPLGRVADASEVADVVVFLASERARYMTGATVDVTGGMLMR